MEKTVDITDELAAMDDFDSAPVRRTNDGHTRTGTVESTISESKIARYEEKCKACRGTGKFRSYTGRVVGDCFKCNGTGVRKFKSAPETRKKAADHRKARLVAKAEAKAAEVGKWLEANPERAAFLKQDWEFPVSLRANLIKYGRLTDNQIAAIDRCLAKQADKAEARKVEDKAAEERGVDLSGFPGGRFMIGELEIKIQNVTKAGKWNGWVFVKDIDDNRLGSQKPGGFYKGKFADELAEIAKDPLAAAKEYGHLTGQCCNCGRTLTNPESIEAGIGPICAAKF